MDIFGPFRCSPLLHQGAPHGSWSPAEEGLRPLVPAAGVSGRGQSGYIALGAVKVPAINNPQWEGPCTMLETISEVVYRVLLRLGWSCSTKTTWPHGPGLNHMGERSNCPAHREDLEEPEQHTSTPRAASPVSGASGVLEPGQLGMHIDVYLYASPTVSIFCCCCC